MVLFCKNSMTNNLHIPSIAIQLVASCLNRQSQNHKVS